ncbi:MAG: site-specific DNA-methyltransferase [Desulfomicrobium sp.]|nr:site-specific DNA-methyltransferase [Pseudomonadota bacterium]MBV1710378.1 site-specific DNA-methyltransferase [Desulfomicrobium sp.]MBU4569999.1 site-specific DNA-methyltransferase [Pseudomonadota bacterium]MBU4593917.1 site-specific DNA-methyltransferase [Pseudomonadota bacterium]MBV1721050.1 site-specific DNA-methyltransferase [Desulfomicrobium sp.]
MPILHWLTREEDLKISGQAPYRLIEPVDEYSYGDMTTGNMIIQGDNLDALKALLPYYAGKAKCIYIDPPYNTKSAFQHYDDNLEHTKWLEVIYPRLEILRDLLKEDGSIWISIDDNEVHYLKIILDEIFGRKNFITNVVWQKKVSPANDALWFSGDHEHLLVYAKNKNLWRPNRLEKDATQQKFYNNPDDDPRGPWNSTAYTCAKTAEERPNLYYPIINPYTGKEVWPKKTRVWAFSQDRHEQNQREKKIYWGKDGTAKMPRFKKFLEGSKNVVPRSIWSYQDAGHTQESMIEGTILFGENRFSTPKPEKLIYKILRIATSNNDLILDSFLGSGTTAAVAHKIGRRYIGIEMSISAETHCSPRLRKVIDGEQGGISKIINWQGGGGFRFYRLGTPIFDENGSIRKGITFAQLGAHAWFSETKTPLPKIPDSPLLGIHGDTAYYLLFNGILKDKSVNGGNVLTSKVLESLPRHDGTKVIYGERCLFSASRLKECQITFKHTPYDIKGR